MLEFAKSENLSLGVELELQIVSPEHFDLTPMASEIISHVGAEHPHIKPEIFESMIELNTGVCSTIQEVREDLSKTSKTLSNIADPLGVKFISAGSHPFAQYSERVLFPSSRFKMLIDRNQYIARRLMIFGIHIHVGMESPDLAIKVNNGILHYLPHLLAFSASSPFWQGSDTGLASSRTTVFEAIPTGGHPCIFNTWSEFKDVYYRMVRSGAITSMKDIWWDVRPSPAFGTIEIRFCDGPPTLDHALALTALVQAICARIIDENQDESVVSAPESWILRENKWRASRHGMDAKIIVSPSGECALLRMDLIKLIQQLEPLFAKLGSSEWAQWILNYCRSIPSYQKQREIFKDTKDLKEVAKYLTEEFRTFVKN